MQRYCFDIRQFTLFFFSFLFALSITSEAATQQRGIGVRKVNLKSKNSMDAPVVEEIELYSASHALVIGIDDYRNGWPRLSKAVSDAQKISDALRKKGFEVTFKKNLTSSELKSAFEEFFIFKGDNPNARLFVWFAGHGHTMEGNGFLVPADAPSPHDGPKFKFMALSMRRFGEFVRMATSKHTYAVFDSCFAGTIFDTRRSIPPIAITRMVTYPVRQFLTSGDSNQTVSDDGRFCKLFLRAISGEEDADANKDNYLTGTELGNFITDRITNLTKAKQTPRYGKFLDEDFDRGDFVFFLPEEKVSPPQSIVSIESDITDARVLVDGKYIGKTNLKEAMVPAGKHQLTIEKEGYHSHIQPVLFKADKEVVLYINLIAEAPPTASSKTDRKNESATATLYVNSNPKDATINIENIEERFYQGISLPAGQYLIMISAQGYKQQSRWITLESGEEKHLPIKLKWIESSTITQNPSPTNKKKPHTLPPISF
ncbi:MAG: PEGA domain-containing protein [Desulfobacteraceae bacterium]|jgi:hypothetical protein